MHRSWISLAVTAAGAVLSPACSFTPGVVVLDGAADSSSSDGGPPTGWSTPVQILELADPDGADDPSLTSDMLELYFGSDRVGSKTSGGAPLEDIWVSKRASVNDPWGAPTNVSELNTTAVETTAKVTANGLAIFFASNRNASSTTEIWASTRLDRSQPWGPPGKVIELSTPKDDYGAFVDSALLHAIYCRGANKADEAMWTAERANNFDPFSTPVIVGELDVIGKSECDPMLPTQTVLYYASDYGNDDGTYDIYRATRPFQSAPFSFRTSISLNVPMFNDRDPWVSADEHTIVFSSDRNGVTSQIYMSTR